MDINFLLKHKDNGVETLNVYVGYMEKAYK
jgi:hypothetical protein